MLEATSIKGFQSHLASCSCKNVVISDKPWAEGNLSGLGRLMFYRGIRCGEVLEGWDFGGIWLHAFCGEQCTIEGNWGCLI